jgi:hypothetical protein
VSFADEIGLNEFLTDFPLMAVRPSRAVSGIVLKGSFAFTAQSLAHGQLTDQYKLQIAVLPDFPRSVPTVTELEQKIPREEGFHVNPDDTLCLGSPLRLLLKLSEAPTLVGFADSCLVPYLFAISYKLRHGGKLLFEELAHGIPGMLADYIDLFGIQRPEQAVRALEFLGTKKRRANKLPCACGCRLRLGKCKFNRTLARFRAIAGRTFYKTHARECRNYIIAATSILARRQRLVPAAAAEVTRVTA